MKRTRLNEKLITPYKSASIKIHREQCHHDRKATSNKKLCIFVCPGLLRHFGVIGQQNSSLIMTSI
jgi:hypothetical protein